MFFAVVKIYSGQTSVESVKVTPHRRSARCCQKTETKTDLFRQETFFCSLRVDPKVHRVVSRCIFIVRKRRHIVS